jgi:hypothetical protein
MFFGLITAVFGHVAAVLMPNLIGLGGGAASTAGSTACVSVLFVIAGVCWRWKGISDHRKEA